MRLSPDIVVTKPDVPEILLAVEVRGSIADIQRVEDQLKAYMVYMSCPVGMLVTWEETRFYRNRYTSNEPQAVDLIGICATRELLGSLPTEASMQETNLERLVLEWLDGLRMDGRGSWPASAREAIESSVLPVVFEGIVRMTGPRHRRAG